MYAIDYSYCWQLGIPITIFGVAFLLFCLINYRITKIHNILIGLVFSICGLAICFQGWKLDENWRSSQLLVSGVAMIYAIENVILNLKKTRQR
jgi:hypothetical protein